MILSRHKLTSMDKETRRPPIFEKSDLDFWTDPYVSKNILHAHLNPEIDDASRRTETIKRSAVWIAEQVGGGSGRRLLDLGCGPGLYCSEFFRLGFEVTGIDFSESSIRHAKNRAKDTGEIITYLHDDIVTRELPRGFDVVTMIYGSFCSLSNNDRDLLLWKLRAVLRPGGVLIFDVFTEPYAESHRLKSDWYFQSSDGFWSPEPHLVLEQSFDYPAEDTYLNQYLVVSSRSQTKKYHVWHHYYSDESITKVMEIHKFKISGRYSDLEGTPDMIDSEWLGLVCRRDG